MCPSSSTPVFSLSTTPHAALNRKAAIVASQKATAPTVAFLLAVAPKGNPLKGALLSAVTLGLYAPYFRNDTHQFPIDRSRLGSKHFRYSGQGGEYFKLCMKGLALSLLTLGLYYLGFTKRPCSTASATHIWTMPTLTFRSAACRF